MTLRVGGLFWIPCEVSPSPFPDECLARIANAETAWVGYMPKAGLRDPNEDGHNALRAMILDVKGDRYLAQPMGHAIYATAFQATLERVTPLGPIAA